MFDFMQALDKRLQILSDVCGAFSELSYRRFDPPYGLLRDRICPDVQNILDSINVVKNALEHYSNYAVGEYPDTDAAYQEKLVWLHQRIDDFFRILENELIPRISDPDMSTIIKKADMASVVTQADIIRQSRGGLIPVKTNKISDYVEYFDIKSWRSNLDGLATIQQNIDTIIEAISPKELTSSLEPFDVIAPKLLKKLGHCEIRDRY